MAIDSGAVCVLNDSLSPWNWMAEYTPTPSTSAVTLGRTERTEFATEPTMVGFTDQN
ncbi:hypothetical protein D3C83_332460 [compost metagenome]